MINFIIRLLKSKDSTTRVSYDLIIVVVDKLTIHFHVI